MKRYLLKIFLCLSFNPIFFLTLCYGGEYNFYFNNTEQGDNSKATPTVTVKDSLPKLSEPENQASSSSSSTKNPTQSQSLPSNNQSITNLPVENFEARHSLRHFRLLASAMYVRQNELIDTGQPNMAYDRATGRVAGGNIFQNQFKERTLGQVELNYFPIREASIGVFAGGYHGAEILGYPIGGTDTPFYLGLGLGLTNLPHDKITQAYVPHAIAELGTAIGPRLGLVGIVRTTSRAKIHDFKYFSVGGGLSVGI